MAIEPTASSAIDLETAIHGTRDGQKPELRLWLRMLSITKLVSQEIRRRLRLDYGATLPQFDLMAQLYREPNGLRLGELSKRTMVTNGNITGLVDRLEADGLVARATPGGDRRVTVAHLTDHGRNVFSAMARAHEGWLRDLMAGVDAATKVLLLQHLAALKASASQHISQGGDDGDEGEVSRASG